MARARAVAGTRRATAAAAATAGTAYLSLAVTPFRGFRDFGIIGGVGHAVLLDQRLHGAAGGAGGLRAARLAEGPPCPGGHRRFERLLPRSRRVVALAVAGVLFVVCAFGAWRYLSHDPLETDLRNLASTSAELDRPAAWMDKFDQAFGHGISGGFALAVAHRAEVERRWSASCARSTRASRSARGCSAGSARSTIGCRPTRTTSWRCWPRSGGSSTGSSGTPTR